MLPPGTLCSCMHVKCSFAFACTLNAPLRLHAPAFCTSPEALSCDAYLPGPGPVRIHVEGRYRLRGTKHSALSDVPAPGLLCRKRHKIRDAAPGQTRSIRSCGGLAHNHVGSRSTAFAVSREGVGADLDDGSPQCITMPTAQGAAARLRILFPQNEAFRVSILKKD